MLVVTYEYRIVTHVGDVQRCIIIVPMNTGLPHIQEMYK